MPRVERDAKQPDVYHFRETEGEKQERLEREDLLKRLEALEAEETKRNPKFQVPDPPKGYDRAS